jgi:hypothetical protein
MVAGIVVTPSATVGAADAEGTRCSSKAAPHYGAMR